MNLKVQPISFAPSFILWSCLALIVFTEMRGTRAPLHMWNDGATFSAAVLHFFTHIHHDHFIGNAIILALFIIPFALFAQARVHAPVVFAVGLLSFMMVFNIAVVFVAANDNGVQGLSGILQFTRGYFWMGMIAPFASYAIWRFFGERFLFGSATVWILFWVLLAANVGYEFQCVNEIFCGDIHHYIPVGENPMGKLAHAMGFITGTLAGAVAVIRAQRLYGSGFSA